MSGRARSGTLQAADSAAHSGVAMLVEAAFAGGTLRLALASRDITDGADTYTATGAFLQLDASQESVDGTEGLTISLSGLDPAVFALVVSEPYKGVVVRILEQRFDADHQAVEAPTVEFPGRIVAMSSSENPRDRTHTVVMQLEHFDAESRRSVNLRFSDAEQRRRYPDDKGAEYVTSLTERVLVRTAGT